MLERKFQGNQARNESLHGVKYLDGLDGKSGLTTIVAA